MVMIVPFVFGEAEETKFGVDVSVTGSAVRSTIAVGDEVGLLVAVSAGVALATACPFLINNLSPG